MDLDMLTLASIREESWATWGFEANWVEKSIASLSFTVNQYKSLYFFFKLKSNEKSSKIHLNCILCDDAESVRCRLLPTARWTYSEWIQIGCLLQAWCRGWYECPQRNTRVDDEWNSSFVSISFGTNTNEVTMHTQNEPLWRIKFHSTARVCLFHSMKRVRCTRITQMNTEHVN